MGSIRTLLVEDSLDYAMLIQHSLRAEASDFDIEHLETLASARARLRAGDIDVVLLDLNLPDSSGIDTVVQMRDACPDVPILVLTNYDDQDLALESVRARADDFLNKGRADGPTLVRAIQLSLARHRLWVELERNVQTVAKDVEKFRQIVETSSDGMVVISREGEVLLHNPAAVRFFTERAEDLTAQMLGFPFTQGARFVREVRAGRTVELHVAESMWDEHPVWLVSLFDITEHRRYQADLEHVTRQTRSLNRGLERLANIDPLTELLNRRGLAAELALEMQRARRTGAPLAAVLIDCDNFKRVNETLGHAVGDVVIRELAHRLKDTLRPSDHISRIGGDEFLVLLPDTRFAEAFQVAERLRLSVSDSPLRLESGPVNVTASLGIEMVTDEIAEIGELLVRTQLSLQHSKRSGKNRVSTNEAGAKAAKSDSEFLMQELEAGTGLRVVRQPILRLEDESVIGWEMLSRGPAGVFEKPRDFFRVALERDVLAVVDLHCLKACLRAAEELPARSRCHVNLFPSTLLTVSPQRLIELFPDRRASGDFCVEISEQQIIGEPSALRAAVRALTEAGILVAIDDVGFGRSSLESLILLEPAIVKIDQRFVQGASRDAGKERSLRRLVGILKSMQCEIVAEGIEQRDDLELLRAMGVSAGQGFLWTHPQ